MSRITCGMDEILPGLHHWTAIRETIGQPVHSAYIEEARTLIDPMVPPEGLGAFRDLPKPERILLTNRHHGRHSERFVIAYGCTVAAHERGLNHLAEAPFAARGFRPGDEVAAGIVVEEVGVLCPDECALHIAVGPGALAVADGVIRGEDGALTFVPDRLLGDDPVAIRRGLAAAYRRICDEREFDLLLLAHGAPFASGGREALRAFADAVE